MLRSRFKKKKLTTKIIIAIILAVLIIFVFLPSFFLISLTFTGWPEIYREVFANPLTGAENWGKILLYLALSLRIAFFVVILDFVIGIPLAYMLARKDFPGKALLEDIITFPLVIPTAGFGFATLWMWTSIMGVENFALIPIIKVPFLILIVHVALTFPYITRTLQAKLQDLEPIFERASRTLGASSFTTFRKVVFPLSLPAMFSGGVLAFARSLGETGATITVASIYTTAPMAIISWVFQFKFASASFLGFLLIIIAIAIILPIEYFTQKKKVYGLPSIFSTSRVEKRVLKSEKIFSRKMAWIKDSLSIAALGLIVILPVLVVSSSIISYWSSDPFTGEIRGSVVYQLFGPSNYFAALLRATLVSVTVAAISTFIAICIAVSSVFLIERYRLGKVIRSLLRIPLIIPTSALGLSVLLLWGPGGLKLVNPGIWLIILTHIVFSVPVIVEPTLATFEGSEIPLFERASRTLGARAYDTLETVSLPMLKRGILAGVILSFTHSLGETGATFLVMGGDVTVPPLVVNMVEALAIPAALFTSVYLIVLSLVLLLLFRIIIKRR